MAGRRLDFFCSRDSIERREQVFGTASTAQAWLLLEYNGPWTPNLLADSDLPDDAKRVLAAAVDGDPDTRLLFIKNDLRGKAGLSFYVAVARERRQALYRFELDDYRDLLAIDVAGLASGAAEDEPHAVDGPLYLVCVDGKHDKCCAKFGLPVYREMVRAAGLTAWQSSHVGGDRFAGNLVCMPHGLYFGRLGGDEALQVVERYEAGEVDLDHYRGRAGDPFPVQAAEFFLRRAEGILGVDDVRPVGRRHLRENLIEVDFLGPAERRYSVQVALHPAIPARSLTCAAISQERPPEYSMVSLSAG